MTRTDSPARAFAPVAPRMVTASPPYAIPLLWLLGVAVAGFVVFLAYRQGLVAQVFETDRTRLSAVIIALAIFGTLHAGWRLWRLASEEQRLHACIALLRARPDAPLGYEHGLAGAYFAARLEQDATTERSELRDAMELTTVLGERARQHHAHGRFLAGALIKLGLLGTVVGFVLMLNSVGAVESFDTSDVQRIMTLMSQGMGVALYTTLVGLVTSMVLGAQYLLADQYANRFVGLAAEFANRELGASRANATNT